MSIYASIFAIDNDEGCPIRGCDGYEEDEDGSFRMTSKEHSCGAIGRPWLYKGSHVFPSAIDERRGRVSLAFIPSHITEDGKDDGTKAHNWLRLSVNDTDVLLNGRQAGALADAIVRWLGGEWDRSD